MVKIRHGLATLNSNNSVVYGQKHKVWVLFFLVRTSPLASCNRASGRPQLGVIVLTILQTGMKKLYIITKLYYYQTPYIHGNDIVFAICTNLNLISMWWSDIHITLLI